jgi:hypothetical protein
MTDANEQSALEKIREHLSTGYSMEEIRSAGWAEWIDYFENKGIDVAAAQAATMSAEPEPSSPPEPQPTPGASAVSDPSPVAAVTPQPAATSRAQADSSGAPRITTANENVKRVEDAFNQDPQTIALIGKAVGVGVVVLGLILALWTAIDLGDFADTSDQIRSFLSDALSYTAFGSLVFLAAVIFERCRRRS